MIHPRRSTSDLSMSRVTLILLGFVLFWMVVQTAVHTYNSSPGSF